MVGVYSFFQCRRHSKEALQQGFTLIELLLVLGLIAALAAAVLPNLGVSLNSQMSLSLREFTETMRATFDSAVLTGRVHRFVILPKTGEYWAEQAPLGFTGRPPAPENSRSKSAFAADDRLRFIEELNQAVGQPRMMPKFQDRSFSVRSILVARRKSLEPIKWLEVQDAVLYKRKLNGSVVFSNVATDLAPEKLDYSTVDKDSTAYVYFFPAGYTTQAVIQIGTVLKDRIDEAGPRFTVNLDPLTGQSELLEGFQDVEFTKPKD